VGSGGGKQGSASENQETKGPLGEEALQTKTERRAKCNAQGGQKKDYMARKNKKNTNGDPWLKSGLPRKSLLGMTGGHLGPPTKQRGGGPPGNPV